MNDMRHLPKKNARDYFHEEGIDFSKNRTRSPSHSTFGSMAIGDLTDQFFPIDQQEANALPNHLSPFFIDPDIEYGVHEDYNLNNNPYFIEPDEDDIDTDEEDVDSDEEDEIIFL